MNTRERPNALGYIFLYRPVGNLGCTPLFGVEPKTTLSLKCCNTKLVSYICVSFSFSAKKERNTEILTVTKRSLKSSILRLSCSSDRVESPLLLRHANTPSCCDAGEKAPLKPPAGTAVAGLAQDLQHGMVRVWNATDAQRRTDWEHERIMLV